MNHLAKAEHPKADSRETATSSSSSRKIRYAVVGLGYISQVAVLPAFAHAKENSELVALVSGDASKLKRLRKKYNVGKTYSYEQYCDCMESGEIDAVYIALPNHMHAAYTEGAANAKIHVLCEKPMAANEEECRSMIDACERNAVKLMIAYRLHFEKGNLSAMEAVRSGRIGDPRIFRSGFSQQVQEGNTRLKEDFAGGPLSDIGVYCINAARYLFAAEPTEVFCYGGASSDPRFKEVGEMALALLRFPGERLAEFACSFGAADRSQYEVLGTKGFLQMDPAYEMAEDLKLEITVDGKTQKARFPKRDQFGPELVYFSDCILQDKQPEPDGKEGLADVRVINALLESQSTGQPVRIAPVEIDQRPSPEQEIHKPPVERPDMVKAASPSK